jgi:hypothetical protein
MLFTAFFPLHGIMDSVDEKKEKCCGKDLVRYASARDQDEDHPTRHPG